MTNSDEGRVFPARMNMLAETASFVEDFCARHGIAHDDVLKLILVVEELFTNTVLHGYGGDCDATVRVVLTKASDGIALLYEDAAKPYDPLARLAARPQPAHDATAMSRAVGGLGVQLVARLASRARYAYEDGHNRLWLRLPCAP